MRELGPTPRRCHQHQAGGEPAADGPGGRVRGASRKRACTRDGRAGSQAGTTFKTSLDPRGTAVLGFVDDPIRKQLQTMLLNKRELSF